MFLYLGGRYQRGPLPEGPPLALTSENSLHKALVTRPPKGAPIWGAPPLRGSMVHPVHPLSVALRATLAAWAARK